MALLIESLVGGALDVLYRDLKGGGATFPALHDSASTRLLALAATWPTPNQPPCATACCSSVPGSSARPTTTTPEDPHHLALGQPVRCRVHHRPGNPPPLRTDLDLTPDLSRQPAAPRTWNRRHPGRHPGEPWVRPVTPAWKNPPRGAKTAVTTPKTIPVKDRGRVNDNRLMTTDFLHPIPAGWTATVGTVGGPSDEFVDDESVAAAIAQRPDSVVALDLPDQTMRARWAGLDFAKSLPLANAHLAAMKEAGLYAPVINALFAYQMQASDGHIVRGLLGLVHTEEFSDGADQPGRILRNEEVSPGKVAERRVHIDTLRHLLSAVLLVPARQQHSYDELLASVFGMLPPQPLVVDTDDQGVVHSLWRLDSAQFGSILDDNIFLVADGNHRSRAAQLSGSPWCLALVVSATGLRIESYHRLLHTPRLDATALRERIIDAGVNMVEIRKPDADAISELDNYLYLGAGAWYRLDLSASAGGNPVDELPHSVVEHRIFKGALRLTPSAEEIQYVGGHESREYLISEVDAGRATAAFILRPVTIDEFTAINAARQCMPRKSTCFMPKPRAGLVIAQAT